MEDPKWIRSLNKLIKLCWTYHSPSVLINFQYFWSEEEKCWRIYAAPVLQEVYGDKNDGKKVWAGFGFDLSMFLKSDGVWVKEVSAFSYCRNCDEGPRISMEMNFKGKPVQLIISMEPLPGFEPVELLDVTKKVVKKIPTKEE